MGVGIPYSVCTTVLVFSSDLQRARNEGHSTTCQFWNFTTDGKQLKSTGIAS